MGKDNQDYFKRAGRSGGPPGPLQHFRQKLSQERATLMRGEERVLPGERRGAPAPHPPGREEAAEPENTGMEARAPTPGGDRVTRASSETQPPSGTEPSGGTFYPRESSEWDFSEPQTFGPPADENSAIGQGPGAQTIPPTPPLPEPVERLVHRFPRAFRFAIWMGRRMEASSRRTFALLRRFDETLKNVGR